MNKLLLDTNAYRAMLEANAAVIESLDNAEVLFLSSIVLGELHGGFKGGTREQTNLSILNTFLSKSSVEILPVVAATSEIYGELAVALRRQGTPIPTNDIWIAAQAMETGSVLLTLDQHFKHVPGLRLWHGLA